MGFADVDLVIENENSAGCAGGEAEDGVLDKLHSVEAGWLTYGYP